MPLVPKDIEDFIKVHNEGKIEEILKFFINIEKREDLSQEDKLRLKIYKCICFQGISRLEEALKLSEEAYQESKKLEKPLILIDAIFNRFMILSVLGRRKGFWKNVVEAEKILKTATKASSSEINERKALLNNMKGHIYRFEGQMVPALECFKESLAVLEKLNPLDNPTFYIVRGTIMMIGIGYQTKGELELALNYYKKCIEFQKPNNFSSKLIDAICFNQIGGIYFQQGDINKAIEHSKRNLETLEKFLSYNYTGSVFTSIIYYYLENKNLEKAQMYLQRFHKYIEKSKGDENFPSYKLAKALILKSSTRTRDRAEAEILLKEVINLTQTRKLTDVNSSIDESKYAIMLLCDLYLTELRSTNDLKILDDIQPLIRRSLDNLERSKSYTEQVYIYFFQGQLALLQMNMGEARRYFTEAQKIAEDHNLNILARRISYEHDKLLEKMDEWENLRKRNISIRERMDLISIEETVDIILQKRGIRTTELTDEIPILFLIIAERGIPIYSKSFTKEKDFQETFISKFLTAFNTYSEQIFSEGLDRATFGNYTLVMAPINSFSLCYLFKGQSYVAKQKLTLFIETLQNNELLWQIFENFDQNNQAIKLNENAPLESLVTEIFIRKTIQITEKEVVIQKEKKICLVCKGKVVKFFYICECGAIYCEKCARAISDLENLCWACNAPIDYSKPVETIKKVVREDIKKNI
ncbi:MAG: tetratricopeptide repeat protein [Promethearchaeota archaeon]